MLKIDRSFMEKLNHTDGTGPIVEAVLSMAHTLNLHVVAEGVETAEQLSSLHKSGCDLIQGYFFSKPVEAAVAAEILQHGRLYGATFEALPASVMLLEEQPALMELA